MTASRSCAICFGEMPASTSGRRCGKCVDVEKRFAIAYPGVEPSMMELEFYARNGRRIGEPAPRKAAPAQPPVELQGEPARDHAPAIMTCRIHGDQPRIPARPFDCPICTTDAPAKDGADTEGAGARESGAGTAGDAPGSTPGTDPGSPPPFIAEGAARRAGGVTPTAFAEPIDEPMPAVVDCSVHGTSIARPDGSCPVCQDSPGLDLSSREAASSQHAPERLAARPVVKPKQEDPNMPGPEDHSMIVPPNPGSEIAAITPPAPLVMEMTVADIVSRMLKIDEIVTKVMVKDEDYGRIPGTKKDTLLQPGAQKLNLAFRLLPRFIVGFTDLGGGHRDYSATCNLFNPVGQFMGSGEGSCSTMEKKYRYRMAELVCPTCGKTTVIKGKEEYGGGWICFLKKGGCGAKWADGDAVIEKQERGQIENPDIADTWNTCKKMACKRALVAATINVLAVSHKFTQDVEDMDPAQVGGKAEAAQAEAAKPEPAKAAGPAGQPAAEPANGNGEPATDAQVDKINRELARVGMGAADAIKGAALDAEYAHTKKGASLLIGWLLKQGQAAR